MRFRPELGQWPVLLVHDDSLDPQSNDLAFLRNHPNLRYVHWSMSDNVAQREKMLTGLVHVPARHVETPWYLKLDVDVVAMPTDRWIDPAWFAVSQEGERPAFVASPWGYTKPAGAIEQLDRWAERIPALKSRPGLNIQANAGAEMVSHPRIASWCFFGNTEWTREVAAYAPHRLPVPSHDTYLFYCAARRSDHYLRTRMKRFGWRSYSRYRRLQEACTEVLSSSITTTNAESPIEHQMIN